MINPNDYFLNHPDQVLSPGIVLFRPLLRDNIQKTIELCGGPARWRPHVKTHKTGEIVQLQLNAGVTKHKCATIAEAELLAMVGAQDVLIAYPMVGPNMKRLSDLVDAYSATRFAILVDSPSCALEIGQMMVQRRREIDCLLDLNPGMDRTGVFLNESAVELYELIATTAGLRAGGLHWYDGQHHQSDPVERREAVLRGWDQFTAFRDRLLMQGFEIPRVVAAGTGSFDTLATTEEPGLELSPGTTTLFDRDYDEAFPELGLRPAATVFTRVVSHSGGSTITVDAGHKSIAGDRPEGHRVFFPQLPDAREKLHSEEHLVLETQYASKLSVGDGLFAIPRHICPTIALHDWMTVVEEGEVIDRWEILGRRRVINV